MSKSFQVCFHEMRIKCYYLEPFPSILFPQLILTSLLLGKCDVVEPRESWNSHALTQTRAEKQENLNTVFEILDLLFEICSK